MLPAGLALLATCGCTPLHTALELGAVASLACDDGTTEQFLGQDTHGHEGNPLLGPYPATDTVRSYFALTALMLIVIDGALSSLPHGERVAELLSAGVLVTESVTIEHNVSYGGTLCGVGRMRATNR